jgi:hypothetical protein
MLIFEPAPDGFKRLARFVAARTGKRHSEESRRGQARSITAGGANAAPIVVFARGRFAAGRTGRSLGFALQRAAATDGFGPMVSDPAQSRIAA